MRPSVRLALACGAALAALATRAAATGVAAPDSHAVEAVRSYVRALQRSDAPGAYALLTRAQQLYFGNAGNFASNAESTQLHIVSFGIKAIRVRNQSLVEVDVDQQVTYYDFANERTATAQMIEPYFALRDGARWGVKELFQPWKSYAPHATGRNGGTESSTASSFTSTGCRSTARYEISAASPCRFCLS